MPLVLQGTTCEKNVGPNIVTPEPWNIATMSPGSPIFDNFCFHGFFSGKDYGFLVFVRVLSRTFPVFRQFFEHGRLDFQS